jgi:hypothetical protein
MKSSSSGTGYGETSECLHSGEWWALAPPFVNCVSGFIVLQYYEVKLRLRFKMNILYNSQCPSRLTVRLRRSCDEEKIEF